MAIQGDIRENSFEGKSFPKKVGLLEAKVLAINPNREEFNDILGITLKDESKRDQYLGESAKKKKRLKVDFWLEEIKTKEKFILTFWLEDEIKLKADGTKTQYINKIGATSYAADENELKDNFKAREAREAHVGEENFYKFLRTWVSNMDYSKSTSELYISWKDLMANNLKDLKEIINSDLVSTVIVLAAVKDDGEKQDQKIFEKAFLPHYAWKTWNTMNLDDPKALATTIAKVTDPNVKKFDLNIVERFIQDVSGTYGCKHYYKLIKLEKYDPENNLVASNSVIAEDDSTY